MKIIERDVSTTTSCFDLPMHPNCLIESSCPECGGPAFPDERIYGAIVNFGETGEPSELRFTCFNKLEDGRDCEHHWCEDLIIQVKLRPVRRQFSMDELKNYPIGSVITFRKPGSLVEAGIYYRITGYLFWDCKKGCMIQDVSTAEGQVVATISCLVLTGPNKGESHGFSSDIFGPEHYFAKVVPEEEARELTFLS